MGGSGQQYKMGGGEYSAIYSKIKREFFAFKILFPHFEVLSRSVFLLCLSRFSLAGRLPLKLKRCSFGSKSLRRICSLGGNWEWVADGELTLRACDCSFNAWLRWLETEPVPWSRLLVTILHICSPGACCCCCCCCCAAFGVCWEMGVCDLSELLTTEPSFPGSRLRAAIWA